MVLFATKIFLRMTEGGIKHKILRSFRVPKFSTEIYKCLWTVNVLIYRLVAVIHRRPKIGMCLLVAIIFYNRGCYLLHPASFCKVMVNTENVKRSNITLSAVKDILNIDPGKPRGSLKKTTC